MCTITRICTVKVPVPVIACVWNVICRLTNTSGQKIQPPMTTENADNNWLAALHYELLTVQRNDAAMRLCLRESGVRSAAFFVDFTHKYSSPTFCVAPGSTDSR